MSWRSSWEGLWRRKPGIYFSRICDKSELDRVPNKFRLIIKEKLKASQYACVVSVIIGIVLLGVSEGLAE